MAITSFPYRSLLSVALWAFFLSLAFAQAYPNKPLRLVIGFPPGGGGDITGRIVGQALGEGLGQPVVIDNRPGAGGIVGADFASKASPDGYTLLLGTTGAITISPSLQPKMPYDTLKDFAPVALFATFQNVLVAGPAIPVNSVKELVALAKAKPGALNYASTGVGATPHLAGELFKMMARVDIVHVSYKGNAPAITDVVGGRVELMFPTMPSALPQIRAVKLKALAVTDARRSSVLPDVPTVSEAGLPGYRVINWFGILAPRGTPAEIVGKLDTTIARALNAAETKERLLGQGLTVVYGGPRQFAEFLQEEIAKWRKVVQAAGIKAE
ncbi:MAG: tripartite tricarboxylate transporter substrate binding protein [Betaproteobacteria bacterium]|nr:tripartite tricarboxylate transporter substrate binding protein [Betaproteobacteria bacterium]